MSQAAEDRVARAAALDAAVVSNFRCFVVLVLAFASVGLCVAELTLKGGPAAFLTANHLELKPRLVFIAAAWGLALLAAPVVLWRIAKTSRPDHYRAVAARLAAPLIVSAFVPPFFVRGIWEGREFAYLAALFVLGLGLERLLSSALSCVESLPVAAGAFERLAALGRSRVTGFVCLGLVLGIAAYYLARIGYLTNLSHLKLNTSSSDLAEYDNLFFNALNGHPFRSPAIAAMMKDFSTLQGHAEFCLYLLLPFYAISPGAHALLWIQAALVAMTAVPLYLLAARRLGPPIGVVVALVFVMMPAVQQPNFYDYHFAAAGMFFISCLLFFVYARYEEPKRRAYRVGLYLSLAAALSCREDMSIGIAVLGVFLILKGVLVREALLLTGIAVAYFVTVKFGIMPLFGTWWFDDMYADLKAQGAHGFGSIILTLLSNPAYVLRTLATEPKALYLLHMTVPVLALWLRRPLLALAILPGFVSTLLATNRPPLFQASFQYTYLWVPYVLAASILALRTRGSWATAFPMLLIAVSLDIQKGVLLGGEKIHGGFRVKTFEFTERDQQRVAHLREIIDMIPKDASVAVTEAEGPHVSTRLVMFSLKFSLGHDPDYLLVGRPFGSEIAHIRQALASGKYGVVAQRGEFILAKRGASTEKNRVLWQRVSGRGAR